MTTTPKRIGLLFAGGTITMIHDGEALRPPDTPLDFLTAMPELAQLESYFDERPHLAGTHMLFNEDSTNLTPAHWQTIARAVYTHLDDYDGFVVTHGTDTMAYTAAALAFMLRGLNKPVVLTGSQVPLTGYFVIDARNNLINAFRAAAIGAERGLHEVVIMFGSQLLRGSRAVKYSVFDFEAFTTFNVAPLGKVGLRFQVDERAFLRSPVHAPQLHDKLETNVALLKLTPGMTPAVFDAVVETGVRGLVVEGFGAGNVPNSGAANLLPSVRRAIQRGVVVVIATQAQVGAADLFYLTGADVVNAGAISAYDMTPTAALVKLMWLLGQHGDNPDAVRRGMHTDYAGELDVRLIR
jgi:L-asparaginase